MAWVVAVILVFFPLLLIFLVLLLRNFTRKNPDVLFWKTTKLIDLTQTPRANFIHNIINSEDGNWHNQGIVSVKKGLGRREHKVDPLNCLEFTSGNQDFILHGVNKIDKSMFRKLDKMKTDVNHMKNKVVSLRHEINRLEVSKEKHKESARRELADYNKEMFFSKEKYKGGTKR